MAEQINEATAPLLKFGKDSYRFVQKCSKPDRKGISERKTVVFDRC
jgi:preprotein translocase subunit Sss1